MKLECVVVCINYSDFLRVTLPATKGHFNKMVVVTDTDDDETAKVCEFNNVQCIRTDAMYEHPNKKDCPNKAKAINEGLKHLKLDGWVLHMDADIWLPCLTRQILEKYPLDPKGVYGVDRLMCNSYLEWLKYTYFGKPLNEGWVYVHTDQFPMGVRLVKYHSEGYIPIGYFQLWNPKASGVCTYPEIKAAYDRTDTMFTQDNWNRKDRHLIADFVVVHLASQNHAQGQNWYGRKTRPFRLMNTKEKLLAKWYTLLYRLKSIFFPKEDPCGPNYRW